MRSSELAYPLAETEHQARVAAAEAIAGPKYEFYAELFHGRLGELEHFWEPVATELHGHDAHWVLPLPESDATLSVIVRLGQDVDEVVEATLSDAHGGIPLTEAEVTEVLLDPDPLLARLREATPPKEKNA